ncbi:hypothetical protein [Bradyrhizobium ottawaense]|uniref:hypothetical protein n=1 Tax=Bradyrhizobium ottawaense TaxID=931866 RepID=UPI003518BD86
MRISTGLLYIVPKLEVLSISIKKVQSLWRLNGFGATMMGRYYDPEMASMVLAFFALRNPPWLWAILPSAAESLLA